MASEEGQGREGMAIHHQPVNLDREKCWAKENQAEVSRLLVSTAPHTKRTLASGTVSWGSGAIAGF